MSRAKQASKRKRRLTKAAVPALVPPDWAYRWWEAHRHPLFQPPTFRNLRTPHPINASFLAKRKWLT